MGAATIVTEMPGQPPRGSQVPSIISADMTIRGDLSGAGDLQIEGKVYGRIDVGHLVLAEGGVVEGEIVAKAARISGTLNGSIQAGTVTLSATARVNGDIHHDVLAIEAGAQLEGQCCRISSQSSGKQLSAPKAAAPVSTPAAKPVREMAAE
jgi:cytoskeletal protein CcmA (bactofilin family)